MDEPRDERRTVTALFADLVGSTALADGLDSEEVRLIVGEAVARMVRAVEAYGGTVKDLAGDGCLALFGAPVAHEDDPERAVLTALRISRDIDDYGREVARSWGVPELRARVGVGTGPVVVGMVGAGSRVEYGAFGDTVNVVARLQAAAEPGRVLVLEATHRLVGDRFTWSEPRQLELKGKPAPVTAYVALSAVERVGELRGGNRATLVGRQREMAMLDEAAQGLGAGSGSIVLIAGEAGIGKSRLVAELRERMGARGSNAEWLVGRCLSYGEQMPYGPFRDLLRDWLGVGSDEPELRTRFALRRRIESLYPHTTPDVYPYLAALLELELEPDARDRLAEQSPEARQYRTWEVIGELLARLAADGPVVAVVEDLHWADPTSLALLERLLPVTEEAAVMLVLTHRAERDHPSWRLRELADRDFPHRTLVVDLAALPGEGERELLAGMVGHGTLPEPVADRLLEVAEGNPFFLEELVRSITDAGALVREGDGWRFDHEVPVEVPPTVSQVINARLDRLAPETQSVVRAAAVLGRRFDMPLLSGVAGEHADVAVALRELQRLDLLREARRWPSPEYQFKHALIQEAAYGSLLDRQRRELHRRAAEWLEARHAGEPMAVAGLLAHHWLQAQDEERAALYLAAAGDSARAVHALDESIGHYRALLPLLERQGSSQEMAIVLFKLAIALHFDLRFAEANATYQEAFALWQPPAPASEPGAELVFTSDRLPDQVDPPRSYHLPSMQVQYALLDRLVELWPERTIVPSLADRWEISDDGLRYVFHLREDASWSDGTQLTARDVEYGIKRNFDRQRPGVSVAMFFGLEGARDYYHGRHDDIDAIGVRALDDHNLELRLLVPAPYLLNIMNRADAGPVPRHAVEKRGDNWTEPDGQVLSGAFRRTEWTPERVVLERRPEGRGPRRGNVGRVRIIRHEPDAAVEAYLRDEVDVVALYGEVQNPRLVEAVQAEAMSSPAAGTSYVYFRHDHAAFGQQALRRALAHAVDREALGAVLPATEAVAQGGLVPPTLHGHTPDIVPRFEPELARSFLAQAADHPSLQMTLPAGGGLWTRIAESLATSWREVLGLDARVVEVERSDWLSQSEGASLGLQGWFPGYPDPEYFLRLLLHSEAKDNFGRYGNPEFDELIDRAGAERDVRRRLELYHQADRLAVASDVALIPLAYSRSEVYVKPWVKGWWEYGKAWSSFADLVIGERSPRHH